MKLDTIMLLAETLDARDLAEIVAKVEADDYSVDDVQTAEHECSLVVVRDADSQPRVIIEITGGGDTIYEPDAWADAVEDYAREHGWDADDCDVPSAYDRAGIHAPTGIQYEPTARERIEADGESYQCELYRQIRGIAVAAD